MNILSNYKKYLSEHLKFSKKFNLNENNCDICNKKNFRSASTNSLLNSKEGRYIYFPTVLCNRCGHAQQFFRFSKNFYKFYYTDVLSSNTSINKYDRIRIKNTIIRGKVLINFLKKKFKLNFKNKKILDIGCGYGGMLKAFSDIGCEVTGIDPDSRTVNVGKKILKNIKLQIENAENLKLKKNYYDLIIINGSLEHVFDANIVMKKVSSFLKNKGYLFLEGKGYPLDIKENYFNFSHQRLFTDISFSNISKKYNIYKIGSSYKSPLNRLKRNFSSQGHKNYPKIKNDRGNLYWLGYKDLNKKKGKLKKDYFFEKIFKIKKNK